MKIAVLGITFRPGTDDLREAPAIKNIDLLLRNGANVFVYNPVGIKNAKKQYKNQIHYAKTPKEALKNSDVCFIFTEWDEIKRIKPEHYKKLMKTPLVYDGRNIYDIDEMIKSEVEYYSIGR